MRAPFVLAPLAVLLALPSAAAGTADAPELSDAAGDCSQPHGNEYADIVAGWISDETETSFLVHMALNKWNDALGTGTGFTLQFEHQDVQFGAVAFYGGAVLGGWQYSNAYIDLDTGQSSDFVAAEGSFTPGSPAIITVEFDKSLFPHNKPDNALRSFEAGSADFKVLLPFFVAAPPVGVPEPVNSMLFDALVGCDIASSNAEYVFQVGGHSMHEMAAEQAVQATVAPTQAAETAVAAPADVQPDGDAPGPGLALLAMALVAVVVVARRRA